MSMFGGIKRGIISIKANDPHLSNLISEEKDKIAAIKATSMANTTSTKFLTLWGESEHADLKDITQKFALMSEEFTMMLLEWEYSQSEFREKLKQIRAISDDISALKAKLKACTEKYEKYKRAGKPVSELMTEIRGLENSLKNEIGQFEGQKRALLQEGMVAQFNGILKFAQKAEQYAIKGNHLAFEIPQFTLEPNEEIPPYNGSQRTSEIQKDFQRNLYNVKYTAMEPPRKAKKVENILDMKLQFKKSEASSKSTLVPESNNKWASFPDTKAQSASTITPTSAMVVDISDAFDKSSPTASGPPQKPKRQLTATSQQENNPLETNSSNLYGSVVMEPSYQPAFVQTPYGSPDKRSPERKPEPTPALSNNLSMLPDEFSHNPW